MNQVAQIPIGKEDDGLRLDRWFKSHYPGVPFGRLSKLCRTGQVRLDGRRVKTGDRVQAGQTVRVPPLGSMTAGPEPAQKKHAVNEADAAWAQSMVFYRDDDVMALSKPPGLAVQGGTNTKTHLDGMLDALIFEAGQRPKLVHRLDKDTSGVLLLARHAAAARALTEAFRERAAEKIYWALVTGRPKQASGKINLKIEKLPGKLGERMAISEGGQKAVTLYATVDHAANRASWLALKPVTGRTHQLRIHCAAIGHPVVGDGKYGGKDAFLTGSISRKLHLHARSLRLPHPSGRGVLDVTAPLPPHMEESWDILDFEGSQAADIEFGAI